jgi:hypothetical protein
MRIAIGIPMIETVPAEGVVDLMALVVETARHGDLALCTPLNVMPHDAARIMAVDDAISQDCELFLSIDDDTIPPKDTFVRLHQTMKSSGAQVVSGHYYRRGYPYTCVWSRKIDGTYFQVDALSGEHEIHVSGLGCALIDLRWVQKNLRKPYFEMIHTGQKTMIADDVTFFTKVNEAGGKVVGNADVRCVHLGFRMPICDDTVDYLRKLHIEKHGPLLPTTSTL